MTALDTAPVALTDQGISALRTLLIQQVTWEAEAVVSIRLVDPTGTALPAWRPGAHLDVLLPSGLVRQYSLCGDPRDRYGYTIGVLKEDAGRGGSIEMHENALVGSTLTVRGPRNHFALEPAAKYLFIAGGIGITPILAMVREAARGTTPWTLVYGGRSLTSMAFRHDIEAIGPGSVELVPQDRAGPIDLDRAFAGVDTGTHIYCCGPSGLLQAVEARCDEAIPSEALHVERFGHGPSGSHVPGELDQAATTAQFEVELRQSGCVVTVLRGQSILDAVRDVAPGAMTSCEEGFCGTCETKVLEGVPEHHDTILSAAERDHGKTVMICVGRAKSARLVLDL